MFKLKLTNTLDRKKEIFKPIHNNQVKLYACGITPYDYSHLGHARIYINFDILVRLLKFLDYKTIFVRNITDIDDKLINKAEKELGDINKYKEITQKFTAFYHEDMQTLNCLKPDFEPKATEYISQMIEFIKKLIASKHAYVLDHDVYFDVMSFKDYGKLSGKNLEDLLAGARVDVNEKKKNVADFALWKGNNQNLFWQSPWGYGRPGWHIECSVMAKEILGESIDIHGGGEDLIFPHHENEIAQSESLHKKTFAKYWFHSAFLNINKEKMSKSLGNFFTIRHVLEKVDPMSLRFYFLQHHYKSPIEFNFDDLMATQKAYEKLVNALEIDNKIQDLKELDFNKISKNNFIFDITKEIIDSLCDDLNTTKAFGIIFKNLEKIKESQELILITRYILKNILGLTLDKIETEKIKMTPEIEQLIKQREQARLEKNWALSDKLRDELKSLGYIVQDKKV
ncbi:MAG: cysteine--tRNA ligase [Candidatus Babeliales bacterium]